VTVRVVTDSTSYLPAQRRERLGIAVVSLGVAFPDAAFPETAVTDAEFYRRMAASREIPTSTQPPPGDLLAAFRDAAAAGDDVVGVFLSSEMSGTYATALSVAHGAKDAAGRLTPIVHRDVSPHNLLVSSAGAVKLIDFGVASLTGQGASGGKLAYSAPEQLLEDETSAKSDQYSLGVVLWECLANRRAFDAEDDVEVIQLVTDLPKDSSGRIVLGTLKRKIVSG
jgi:hypothetical protein